jgi:hypothetical protein
LSIAAWMRGASFWLGLMVSATRTAQAAGMVGSVTLRVSWAWALPQSAASAAADAKREITIGRSILF